jgi:hypothetical protein
MSDVAHRALFHSGMSQTGNMLGIVVRDAKTHALMFVDRDAAIVDILKRTQIGAEPFCDPRSQFYAVHMPFPFLVNVLSQSCDDVPIDAGELPAPNKIMVWTVLGRSCRRWFITVNYRNEPHESVGFFSPIATSLPPDLPFAPGIRFPGRGGDA